MKNIEYTQMAYLYDKFYAKKNYKTEVKFIERFIKNKNCNILDAGCGTGTHATILHQAGYKVNGFDKSAEMVAVANSKIPHHFSVNDLLTYTDDKKYDVVISFFAVFNHLKNYKEFKIALSNLKSCLSVGGIVIIDLHNPQSNGKKVETIGDVTRIMQWRRCRLISKEFTKITYVIDGKKHTTSHTFKIFNLANLERIARSLGFKTINVYANYDVSAVATPSAKNIQMVLYS
jgi:2-polyprenyl-3-methyl-5-hydroxy-6-metoxy-1,4-benzoquinol methylase